jgi:hypothetical protein
MEQNNLHTIQALITPLNEAEEKALIEMLKHPLMLKHLRNVMHTAIIDSLMIPYSAAATEDGKRANDLERAYQEGIIANCNTLLEVASK